MDTAAAKAKVLGATMTAMWNNTINSSAIKGGLDGLTSLASGISNLTSKFGLLPPIIATVGTAMAAMKSEWSFTSLASTGITNMKTALDSYSTSYEKYIAELTIAKGEEAIIPSNLTKMQASMSALNEVTGLSTIAMKGFNIALNTAIGFGIGAAITGLIGLFTSWANKIKDTQTDIDSLSSKTDTLKQNDSLISQYQNLSTQLQNTSKDSTDYKNIQGQVVDMQKQLAQQFPSLIDGYDKQGNAIVQNIDKLKEYNNQQKLLIQAQASKDYSTMYDKITQKGNYLVGNSNLGISIGNDQTSELDKYNKYVKLLDDEMKTTGVDTQGYSDKLKDVSSHIQSFNENAVKLYSIGQTNVQYFDTATGKLVNYSNYLKQNQQDTQGATNATNADTSALGNNTSATNANSSAKNANGQASNNTKGEIQSLGDVMTDLSSSMAKEQTNLTDINQLLDKHKQSGEWDYATIIKLANNGYPSLISAMGDDKQMTDILIQAKQDEVNKAEDSLKQQIQMEKDKVNSVLVAYGLDVSNFDNAEKAKTAILQAEVKKRMALLQAELKAYTDNAQAQLDKASSDNDSAASEKSAELYLKDKAKASNVQSQIDGLNSGDLSKADPTLSDNLNNYFNLKNLQTAANNALNGVGSTADDGKTNSSGANTQASKDLTAQSRDLANQSRDIAIQSRNLDMQNQQITNQVNALDAQSRQLTDQSQALSNQSQILNIQKQEQETDMQNAENARQQNFDAIIKGYQDQLDALKQKKQLQDDTNTLLKDENDLIKAQQDLQNAQNEKNVRIYENGKWQWEANQSQVSSAHDTVVNAQQTLSQQQANMAEKAQEDALSAKIKSTQDAKSADAQAYTNQKNALDQSYQKQQDAISLQKINIQNQQTNISDEKANLDQEKQNIQNEKTNLDNAKNDIANQQNGINNNRNALAGYADGTNNADAGVKQVSENGMEIVIGNQLRNFQGGETVINNANTQKLLQGTSSVASNTNAVSDTKATLNKVGQTINSNKNLVKTPVNNLLNEINNRVQQFVDQSPKYSHDTNNNMGKSVTDNKNLLEIPINNVVNEIKNHLQQFVDGAGQYGKNGDDNIGTAVTKNADSVYSPTKTLISNVKGLIEPFVSSMQSEGKEVDVKLGQGMNDGKEDLNKNVEDLCKKMIDTFHEKLGIHSPSTVMHEIGGYMIQGLINGMNEADIEKFITDKISAMTGVMNSQVANVPGTVTDWLTQAIKATGQSMDILPMLQQIAMHESGGDPNSINTYDINAIEGHPSQGLMQTIPSTFQEYMMAGHNNILNPVDNAIAAIRYMLGRYGSVANVPGIKSLANGGGYIGYQNGTENVPITDRYKINENGEETVLLNKGSGVITSERTHSLNLLADNVPNIIDTVGKISMLMPQINIPDFSNLIIPKNDVPQKSDTYINIDHVDMSHVFDSQGFVDSLTQINHVSI